MCIQHKCLILTIVIEKPHIITREAELKQGEKKYTDTLLRRIMSIIRGYFITTSGMLEKQQNDVEL